MNNPFQTISTPGRRPAPSFVRRDIPVRASGVKFYQLVLPAQDGLHQRWVVELSGAFTRARPITRHFTDELPARDWLTEVLATPHPRAGGLAYFLSEEFKPARHPSACRG
ncbi:MAG: hypothetical protein HYV95_10510 [Opitutae bacterium]|nr:hypothetical protein [Opitutae bacterium]